MKGVIFTQLIHHLEDVGGEQFVDEVLAKADLPNDGAFTSIGSYPSAYAFKLIEVVSDMTGQSVSELSKGFGEYLFGRFVVLYPEIMSRYEDAEAMLGHVGSHIHEEVVVLYPDATPPAVRMSEKDGQPVIHYSSHRPLAHLAFGLIKGCLKHYADDREVVWVDGSDASSASFLVTNKQES